MDRISSHGKSCTIVCALLLQEQLDKSVTSHTLEDLQPYQEYSFRIVAHNGNGPGMSTEEVVTRTLSDTPSGVPQNFTLEAASSLVRMFQINFLFCSNELKKHEYFYFEHFLYTYGK